MNLVLKPLVERNYKVDVSQDKICMERKEMGGKKRNKQSQPQKTQQLPNPMDVISNVEEVLKKVA